MSAFWNGSNATIRILFIVCATLLVAGLVVSAIALFSTTAGSASFDTGLSVGRVLLQIGAGAGVIGVLLNIKKQRQERDSQ